MQQMRGSLCPPVLHHLAVSLLCQGVFGDALSRDVLVPAAAAGRLALVTHTSHHTISCLNKLRNLPGGTCRAAPSAAFGCSLTV